MWNFLTLTLTLNILTAFIRLGRAGPAGAGCPPILQGLGRMPSIFISIVPSIIIPPKKFTYPLTRCAAVIILQTYDIFAAAGLAARQDISYT